MIQWDYYNVTRSQLLFDTIAKRYAFLTNLTQLYNSTFKQYKFVDVIYI